MKELKLKPKEKLNIDYKKIKELNNAPELGEIINIIYDELDVITQTQLLKDIDNPPEILKPEIFTAIEGYSIIRVVVIIEQFFRNLVKTMVDLNPELAKLVVTDGAFDDPHITIGQAVSTSFHFQNPNNINMLMTKILELHFFGKMKEHLALEPDSKAGNVYARAHLNDNWDDLLSVFEYRHQLSHSLKTKIELKRGYLRGLLYSAEVFLYLSLAMASSVERIRQKKVAKENYETEFDNELEKILKPNI